MYPLIANVEIMQRRMFYTSISMNVFGNKNALMVQRRRCCASIPMNVFGNINAFMVQRRRCCTYDSPGLASESEGYPGSFAVSGNNAVGVVPFIPQCFIVAFHVENVQHLRR